jgi:hypothetical protein
VDWTRGFGENVLLASAISLHALLGTLLLFASLKRLYIGSTCT